MFPEVTFLITVSIVFDFTEFHPPSPPSQHVDIAALLIKYSACVNATDKWAFTPLHEAAQKGRTQLCALLLAHGADPSMKNQEGQTPLDLATVRAWVLSNGFLFWVEWRFGFVCNRIGPHLVKCQLARIRCHCF